MNLSNALEAPREGDWGYTVRTEDIDRLAEAGFDTIRIPVRWSAHAGWWGKYKLKPDMLERTDALIDHALARGMNVILNVHHYNQMNARPRRHERRLEGIWKQLASHYRDYPDSLIFEVLNEPNRKMTPQRTDALNKRIVRNIHADQPTRWVILATAEWGTLRGLLKSNPPADPFTILSLHYYEPFAFTHQGADFYKPTPPPGRSWGAGVDTDRLRRDFAAAAGFRDAHNQPLLLGEFGVYGGVPDADRAQWVRAARKAAEEHGFGWCHWGFSGNFNVYDVQTETWNEPMRAALLDD
ncbi:glycoside hydrolase family protein [Hyphomonas johnsonii MHS-2]|uniref:Glycoside hydrolase family protein n=2 Tax=Hyphomonas johnsonii TaxID=81031 RepID=A0A059FTM2_9PROT|nr:glycoside hydrolase family protein [Hyphomonas johnsonii MHS-2]